MPALINVRNGEVAVGVPTMEYECVASEFFFHPAETHVLRLIRWEF
jgi:hypothetical protein